MSLPRVPTTPGRSINLGLLASEKHQYAEAKDFFQRAMELMPNLAEPHLRLGDTYLKMGLRGPAELQLRAAVAISPTRHPRSQ